MAHLILPYVLVLFGFAAPVAPRQDVNIRPRETPPRSPERVTKPRTAKVATNGVLFVLTAPFNATITVRNRQGNEVKRETIEDGEFRAELAAGTYDIEVAAAGYYPITRRGVVVRPPREKVERAILKPTTGSITIGLSQIPDPDAATILIDGRSLGEANIKARVKREERQIELDGVEEGYHTLTIKHSSIAPYTRERLEVRGGSITILTPGLTLAVVTFVVKSEQGATIFIDGNNEGRVQENGVLKVSTPYSPGAHTIKAEMDGKFESSQVQGSYDTGEHTVEVKLTRIIPSPEYSMSIQADTLQEFWDAPGTWRVTQGNIVVGGPESGLLKERRWMDFTWVFDITFVNDKGACWIVRARDKQNYYLFQLGGLKGVAPKYFRSYIFQDGRFKILDNVQFVEDLSSPKDSYTIKVEASGRVIKHYIQRKNDPAQGFKPVHTLTDDRLPYGTVGFQAKDGEEFTVFTTVVMPEKPKPSATR